MDDRFLKRSQSLRSVLFAVMSEGPASWEAIFGAGRALNLSDSTIRNTVNEGVAFGVFSKSGGKAGRNNGNHPKAPPMVSLTEYGNAWLATEIEDDGEDIVEALEFCPHDNIVTQCDECSPEWRAGV